NQIDPTDFNIFYTESQNAGIQRYDNNIGDARSIKPNLGGGGRGGGGGGGGGEGEAPPGAPATRANIINPVGGAIVQFNCESPLVPGILWAGTDDGNVQLSRDGAATWEEVGKNIPGVNHEYYISGLEASWYDAGTAYVALDGHRNDDLKPYIFKTTDYGKTWTSVTGNLPTVGNVNSIRLDPGNRNLLYAPTELGLFIAL